MAYIIYYIICFVFGALLVLGIFALDRAFKKDYLQNPTVQRILFCLQEGRADLVNALRIHSGYKSFDLKEYACGNERRVTELIGVRLDGLKLDNMTYCRCDLSHAVFIGASLYGTSFEASNLNYAIITNCAARGSVLKLSSARYAQFSGIDLSHATLGGDFSHASFRGAIMKEIKTGPKDADAGPSSFVCADLRDANLTDGILHNVNLSEANCDEAIFDGVNAEGMNLERAHLYQTSFVRSYLTEARLTCAHAERACFDLARLVRAMLNNTYACHASFKAALMQKTNMREAILTGADFSGAAMQEAHLDGAKLGDAFFHEANLSKATFKGADLSGADFSGADLQGADLSGADLKNATFDEARLAGIIWNDAKNVPAEVYERSAQETKQGLNLVRTDAQAIEETTDQTATSA